MRKATPRRSASSCSLSSDGDVARRLGGDTFGHRHEPTSAARASQARTVSRLRPANGKGGESLTQREGCPAWVWTNPRVVGARAPTASASTWLRACARRCGTRLLRNVMKEAAFGGTLWLSSKTGLE